MRPRQPRLDLGNSDCYQFPSASFSVYTDTIPVHISIQSSSSLFPPPTAADIESHDDPTMSSTNFAAAQQRVLERRRLHETESRARFADQRASPANNAATQRLPFPFNKLPLSASWVWSSLIGREGNRPAFRVGQVDAELLDEELLDLLKGQVGEALKYYGVLSIFSEDLVVY